MKGVKSSGHKKVGPGGALLVIIASVLSVVAQASSGGGGGDPVPIIPPPATMHTTQCGSKIQTPLNGGATLYSLLDRALIIAWVTLMLLRRPAFQLRCCPHPYLGQGSPHASSSGWWAAHGGGRYMAKSRRVGGGWGGGSESVKGWRWLGAHEMVNGACVYVLRCTVVCVVMCGANAIYMGVHD